jgi:hypothetical protein
VLSRTRAIIEIAKIDFANLGDHSARKRAPKSV